MNQKLRHYTDEGFQNWYKKSEYHVHWLYCLKLFKVRKQFHLSKREEDAIIRIVIFIIKIYIKPWTTANIASLAVTNDIELIRNLFDFIDEDKNIAESRLKKMTNHLWYLNEELVTLSIVNKGLSSDVRRKLAEILQSYESHERDETDEQQESSDRKPCLKFEQRA